MLSKSEASFPLGAEILRLRLRMTMLKMFSELVIVASHLDFSVT